MKTTLFLIGIAIILLKRRKNNEFKYSYPCFLSYFFVFKSSLLIFFSSNFTVEKFISALKAALLKRLSLVNKAFAIVVYPMYFHRYINAATPKPNIIITTKILNNISLKSIVKPATGNA